MKYYSLSLLALLFSLSVQGQWDIVGPPTGFSEGASWMQQFLFHPTTQEPHVAFYDYDPEFYEVGHISMARFDGTEWVYVGNRMFSKDNVALSSGIQDYGLSISFDLTSDEPYVCFRRVNTINADGASVMFFDGANWVQAGDVVVPGTEDGMGYSVNGPNYAMDVNPINGEAAVAYQEPGSSGSISALSWDDLNWGSLDVPSFLTYPSSYHDLTFDSEGTPYIIHDATESGNLGVVRYDGGNWVQVGSGDISDEPTNSRDNCIRFHPVTNAPYVAYRNFFGSNGGTVNIKMFNGTDWVLVGEQQEQEIQANFPGNNSFSMKIHPMTGVPYLIYRSFADGSNPVVKYFDGSNWLMLGTGSIVLGVSEGMDIDFHPVTGLPHVIVINASNKGVLYSYAGPWITELDDQSRPMDLIAIYPNPSSGTVLLQVQESGTLRVYGLDGKLHEERTLQKGTTQLDLEVGGYFIDYLAINGLSGIQRLIITE